MEIVTLREKSPALTLPPDWSRAGNRQLSRQSLDPATSLLLEGGKDWQAYVTVSPPPLVPSERKLVEGIREFWENNRETPEYCHVEVCLLRNLPKVGVGMFVRSGFYPDFIF
jgi:hypothetical protein